MSEPKVYTVIGLMSGTSIDGIDAALIRTDGIGFVERIDTASMNYEEEQRELIRAQFTKRQRDAGIKAAEKLITDSHGDVIEALLAKNPGINVDLIGFHGQTITHALPDRLTWQIGDGQALADRTGIPVVYDFRSNDVKHGGNGAPLIPLYHRALAISAGLDLPCAIQNIGGVGNVTYIGSAKDEDILAFDTGPGNAYIDDLMLSITGWPYDKDGALAAKGIVDEEAIQIFLDHPYFAKTPPKALDRREFDMAFEKELSLEDKLATATEITARTITASCDHFPIVPKQWIICGGGRHNDHMMTRLSDLLGVQVQNSDDLGWDGDFLEAEGFAYLAVRSMHGWPISLPSTTGVSKPMSGGELVKPRLPKVQAAS